jgi:hypothetical protein
MRWAIALPACIAVLALPSAALGAVRCVPAAAPGCTSSHATIAAAVTAAANDDTVRIAAGSYAEAITTTKRLSFVGAGAGTLASAAGATVVAPSAGSAFTLQSGGSVRGVRAVGSSGFSGGTAFSLAPSVDGAYSYTLTDVIGLGGHATDVVIGFAGGGLSVFGSASRPIALAVANSTFQAGSSIAPFPGTGAALSGASLNANLTGVTVLGPSGSGIGSALVASGGTTLAATGLEADGPVAAQLSDATVDIRRSELRGTINGVVAWDSVGGAASSLTLSDSLVVVTPPSAIDATAVYATTYSGAGPLSVVVRGSTVVARGVDPKYAVVAQPNAGAPAATVELRNSIARLEGGAEAGEADIAADRGTVTAAHSNFATRLELNGGSATAPGSGANLNADPLFTAGAFTLQSGSPLIDRGDAAIVTAGELDLAGKPRTIGAAPDIGAFEFQPPVAPPPPPPPAANDPPVLSSVSMSNKVFGPAAARAAGRRARVKRGTTFRYALSEAATVTIVIERKARGGRVRGRCRKPARGRRPCTRWLRAVTLSPAEQAGRQSTFFGGRARGRALPPGRYRARIRARDGLGARSAERRLAFRIVRAR